MFASIVIAILTLTCFFLLWKNGKESKDYSLEKLDFETKVKKLEDELLKTEEAKFKAEQMVDALTEVPDVNFKYNTIFGSSRSKGMRDKIVARTKEIGYSIGRSYAVWSLQEDQALEHRFKVENKSVLQLAVIHERTTSAVSRRLKTLGLL